MVAHSSILAWKSREQRGMVGYSPRDCKRVGCGLVAKQKQNKVRMTFLNGGGGGGISTRLILGDIENYINSNFSVYKVLLQHSQTHSFMKLCLWLFSHHSGTAECHDRDPMVLKV